MIFVTLSIFSYLQIPTITGKEGNYQVILKQVELPVVGNNQCQKKLRTVEKLGKFFR